MQDLQELIRLLEEHPHWRAQLRQILLTQELLELPERLSQLTRTVETLSHTVETLSHRVELILERLDRLEDRQDRMEDRQDRMEASLNRLEKRVGNLEGKMLEQEWRYKFPSKLGRILKRPQILSDTILEDTLDDYLTELEADEVRNLDLIITGRLKPTQQEVWIALEISKTVDISDVERASRRAQLLNQTPYQAIPGVAGEEITNEACSMANSLQVLIIDNGRIRNTEILTGEVP
jgi:vacuolar-type H+-ATPase subunit I/STV1